MSDDAPTPVLDLVPRLVERRRADCKHPRVYVFAAEGRLECQVCEGPVDVWWYLDRMATNEEGERKRIADMQARVEAERQRLQGMLVRLTAEVNALIEQKNKLWNETVPGTGRPLGAVASRAVSRAVTRTLAAGKPSTKG